MACDCIRTAPEHLVFISWFWRLTGYALDLSRYKVFELMPEAKPWRRTYRQRHMHIADAIYWRLTHPEDQQPSAPKAATVPC